MMRCLIYFMVAVVIAPPGLVVAATAKEFAAASMVEQTHLLGSILCGEEGQFGDLELLGRYVDYANAEYAKRPNEGFRNLGSEEIKHLHAVQEANVCTGRALTSCRLANRIAAIVPADVVLPNLFCDMTPTNAPAEVTAEMRMLYRDALEKIIKRATVDSDPSVNRYKSKLADFLCRWGDDRDACLRVEYDAIVAELSASGGTRATNSHYIGELASSTRNARLMKWIADVRLATYTYYRPNGKEEVRRGYIQLLSQWRDLGVDGAAEALAALERGESWIDNPPPLYSGRVTTVHVASGNEANNPADTTSTSIEGAEVIPKPVPKSHEIEATQEVPLNPVVPLWAWILVGVVLVVGGLGVLFVRRRG